MIRFAFLGHQDKEHSERKNQRGYDDGSWTKYRHRVEGHEIMKLLNHNADQ